MKLVLILAVVIPCYGIQCQPKAHGKGSGTTQDSIVRGDAMQSTNFAAVTIEHFGHVIVCNKDMLVCWFLR